MSHFPPCARTLLAHCAFSGTKCLFSILHLIYFVFACSCLSRSKVHHFHGRRFMYAFLLSPFSNSSLMCVFFQYLYDCLPSSIWCRPGDNLKVSLVRSCPFLLLCPHFVRLYCRLVAKDQDLTNLSPREVWQFQLSLAVRWRDVCIRSSNPAVVDRLVLLGLCGCNDMTWTCLLNVY